MVYRISIQRRALAEMNSAYRWIEEREPVYAARWLARLHRKIETLTRNPQRCPFAEESEVLGFELRELLFGRRRNVYRILFTVEGELVSVLSVRHAARQPLTEDDIEN
jgi:plasmid stabilization system protein ParE